MFERLPSMLHEAQAKQTSLKKDVGDLSLDVRLKALPSLSF